MTAPLFSDTHPVLTLVLTALPPYATDTASRNVTKQHESSLPESTLNFMILYYHSCEFTFVLTGALLLVMITIITFPSRIFLLENVGCTGPQTFALRKFQSTLFFLL